MKRGNWTDNDCYYVSVIDGPQYALLAGPFKTHKEALNMVDTAKKKRQELDRKSVFYAFGTCKVENGHREGILNEYLNA